MPEKTVLRERKRKTHICIQIHANTLVVKRLNRNIMTINSNIYASKMVEMIILRIIN